LIDEKTIEECQETTLNDRLYGYGHQSSLNKLDKAEIEKAIQSTALVKHAHGPQV
jgi:hypothetical protein